MNQNKQIKHSVKYFSYYLVGFEKSRLRLLKEPFLEITVDLAQRSQSP